MTTTATLADAGWKLTARVAGTGSCDHCSRDLAYRYLITTPDGREMVVGRGCLKTLTGWTLSVAQAEREIRWNAIRAARAARWADFAAAMPTEAATIVADCEAYAATTPASQGGGASHEIRLYIENGEPAALDLLAAYMARRATFRWTR